MTAVFSHGRLRLYLLTLLDDGPRHGYELIRLMENRFHGLYAPSAGTIYPRLQRLESEGLVTHTAAGGRKTYQITDAGRAELRRRAGELAELETDIRTSVADLTSLAEEIQSGVRGSVRDLKRELRAASREFQGGARRPTPPTVGGPAAPSGPAAPTSSGAPGGAAAPDGWTTTNGRFVMDAQAGAGGAGGSGGAGGAGDAAEAFDRRLDEFVAEVRRLVHGLRLTDPQLRTAVRMLDGALDGLRRLLR